MLSSKCPLLLPVATLACVFASLGCNTRPTAATPPAATAPTVSASTSQSRVVANAAAAPSSVAPIVLDDTVREAVPNDYLRVVFIPPQSGPDPVPVVTMLGRSYNLRVFATATTLYQPPLTVSELPAYSGLQDNSTQYMMALRCRPPQPANVDAILATWPNVFQTIPIDTKLDPTVCSANPSDPTIQTACYASAFTAEDTPSGSVPTALGRVFSYAAVLFDDNHTAQAQWLKNNYGIYPAFAGTGYSVKDSYTLDASHPQTTATILAKSVSSEYLLKNVSLADAGCRCIAVPPYPQRAQDRLDPATIDQIGGNGSCNVVTKLPQTSH
jgi:hypothetical protein